MRVEKKTEVCQYGPQARLPRQGGYSRPHQSQEIVKSTPFRLIFIVLFSSSVLVISDLFCVDSVDNIKILHESIFLFCFVFHIYNEVK